MAKGSVPVNAVQHGGTHYQCRAIQPWDYIIANGIGFLEEPLVPVAVDAFRQYHLNAAA